MFIKSGPSDAKGQNKDIKNILKNDTNSQNKDDKNKQKMSPKVEIKIIRII